MSAKHNDGGPAFPLLVGTADHIDNVNAGMSLRDYFAASALRGLCANPGGPFQANATNGWSIVNCDVNFVAETAYELANAMLVERAKERA